MRARTRRRPTPDHSPKPLAMRWGVLLAIPLAWLALACGDPGMTPGGAPSGGAQTASVSVFVTDAPSDAFLAINLTVTKITLIGGPAGQVTLFEGLETFDLLNLRNVSEVFAIRDDVPVGLYKKVRLTLADDGLELVEDDGQGGENYYYPDLPGNNKLDLIVRDPINLRAGEAAGLEIDVDVEKSIHVHANGNGEYKFRPVVFVRLVRSWLDGRLVRLHGEVENIDVDAGSFSLCRLRRPLAWIPSLGGHAPHPDSADFRMEAAGSGSAATERAMADTDSWYPRRHCIAVRLDDDASLFDENGLPIRLADLIEGEEATVLGHVFAAPERRLVLAGALVLAGPRGTYEHRIGFVASDFDPGTEQVVLALASGNGDLTLQLFPTTKLFERGGLPVGTDAIMPGVPAGATGVIFFSSTDPAVMNTALLILDLDDSAPDPLHGPITSVTPDPAAGECHLEVDVDGTETGVAVGDRTVIFLIDSASSTSTIGDLDDLATGDVVDVYGRDGTTDSCFDARVIVAFPPGP